MMLSSLTMSARFCLMASLIFSLCRCLVDRPLAVQRPVVLRDRHDRHASAVIVSRRLVQCEVCHAFEALDDARSTPRSDS